MLLHMRYTEKRDAVLRALTNAHGAAKQRFLVPLEHDRRALARMVAEGAVTRHPQHVIALPGTDQRIIIARRLGALIACAHAMDNYGIALQRSSDSRLHLIVPRGRRLVYGIGRTVIHQVADVHVDPLGSPFADHETAILTFMRCAPELDALIALDCALRGGMVVRDQLLARLRGPRNSPMRELLARANPKARSILETIARYELEEAGAVPDVAVEVPIGELDLTLGFLAIEPDGYAFHSSLADWTRDHHRDQWLLLHGMIPLHLTAQQVLAHRTVEIVRLIAERLGCWPADAR